MNIETFEMERLQSTWENVVECDLSESGTRAVTLAELMQWGFDLEPLLRTPLGYSQTNGTVRLRQALAAHYPGATPDHIMVTNGSAEANFLVLAALLRKGDAFALEVPNFMQVKGLAEFWTGQQVETFRLRFDAHWTPDWNEFERAVRPGTKAVYITNPNNPTGKILDRASLERIVERCEQVGAWMISDEVYIGSEIDRPLTPTAFGLSERVIVVSGLSKAFGIPGLRIGWLVCSEQIAAETWRLHDYTTIGPAKLSDAIAHFAVQTDVRDKLYARTRRVVQENLPIVEEFVSGTRGLLQFDRPESTAMAFLRWCGPGTSGEFCRRMLDKHSVLLVDGALLGLDGYIRLWTGGPGDKLMDGLRRIGQELQGYSRP